jgi:hypothetical protein
MKMNKINLNNHKSNLYSQSGEDGIIEKLLDIQIFESNFQFVEFGAHDGVTNSNCFNLLKNKNYKGLFIEPDNKRFQELLNNTVNYNSINLKSFVTPSGETSLDNILTNHKFDKNFDLLSIDIDGFDYQIFEGLRMFKPKIVIIEYNPTIPNDVNYIQPYNTKSRHGSSPKSLIELGVSKGYSPVALTDTNIFLLDSNIFNNSNLNILELNEERDDTDTKINVFYGYNGDIIFSQRYVNLRWHILKYDLSKVQLVPKFLRILREDYSKLRKIVYNIYSKYLKLKLRFTNHFFKL